MSKILSFLVILSFSTACIKTAEQVQREKRFDSISEQMTDSQSLLSDLVAQMKSNQKQLDDLNGRLEVLEHKQKGAVDSGSITGLNENMTLLKNQREADSAQMTAIQNELKEQRAFLEKVTTSLSNLQSSAGHHNNAGGNKAKKKSVKEELNDALELVKSNDYAEARSQLLTLIDHKELTPGDHNKLMHGLGRVEFHTKNFDKALVYFSKIYSKYPKASLAPSSLLYIGKSLKRLGKKDEAKEAFAKLSEDYPSAREVGEAKKEL